MGRRGTVSRAVATRFGWPGLAGLGCAAGLLPALLWRLPARGPVALPLLTLLLTAVGGLLAAGAAGLAMLLAPRLRAWWQRFGRARVRRSARIAVPVLTGLLILVLACWVALDNWPGSAAATGAGWVLRSLAAIAAAWVPVLAALWPELLGRPRRRRAGPRLRGRRNRRAGGGAGLGPNPVADPAAGPGPGRGVRQGAAQSAQAAQGAAQRPVQEAAREADREAVRAAGRRRIAWVLAAVPAGYLTAALLLLLLPRTGDVGQRLTSGALVVLCVWFLILLIPSRTSVFAVAHVAGAIPAAVWLILLIQLGRDTPDRLAQNLGGALHWLGGTAAALVFAIGTAHGLRTRIDRLAAASPQALAVRARATIELPAVAFPAFLLFAGQILGGVWEAPLFLLMVWYSVALWRRLAASERAALSAAADVVLALLLGAVLVLLLVWLGNLLDLAPAEMTLVHGVAEHAAALADLPWWAWALCYALLAAGYLTALLLPGRALGRAALRALTGRRTRRVTPAVNALHRGLTVTRIALVLVVFVGLAAPPAVGGLLARQARAHYTVSLRKELQAEGESAFYRSVIARFAPRAPRPAVLAQMVLEIHETEPAPDHGRDGAAPAELLLAHRLGLLAARAADPTAYDQLPESITNRPPAPQEPASDAVLRQETAPYADPPPGVGQLDTRLAGDRAEQRRAAQQEHERDELRDLAAELTATAVTSALDSLPLGRSEALGVVREYLDGLAESPLRDRFLAWTARVERAVRASGIRRPPAADTLVDPDPTALRLAADAQLTDDLMAAHDLTGTDPEQKRADGEAPLAGAVHLAQQSQGVETGSHPCTGCVHLPQPGEGEHGGIGGEEGGFHGE